MGKEQPLPGAGRVAQPRGERRRAGTGEPEPRQGGGLAGVRPDEVPKVNLQRAVYAYYGYSPPEGTVRLRRAATEARGGVAHAAES